MIGGEKLLIVNNSLKVKQSAPLVQNPAFTHLDTKVFGVNYSGTIEFPPDEDFYFEFIDCIFNNVTFVSPQSEAESLTFKYCIFKNCTFKEDFWIECYDCSFLNCTFDIQDDSDFENCIFDGEIKFVNAMNHYNFRSCSFEGCTKLDYPYNYVKTLDYDMFCTKNCGAASIVFLKVPKGAKIAYNIFNSAKNIRSNRAIVEKIVTFNGDEISSTWSKFDMNFIYKTGEEVYPDSFDERWWITNTHGIHCRVVR